SFVHEMNHAHYHHAGLKADINGTRDDYVTGKLHEEAEGTVLSIRAKMELEEATGGSLSSEYPLEQEYREAYNAQIEAGESVEVAQQAGLERVIQGFWDGEVVTSVRVDGRKLPYPDYYGRAWDRAHPDAAAGGGGGGGG